MEAFKKGKMNDVGRRQSEPKKKGKAIVIIFLTILLISLILTLSFVFNIGEIKDIVLNQVKNKQEEFQEDVNRDNENLFALQQAKIDEQKKHLEELERRLNAKSSELAKKEEELERLIEEAEASKAAIEKQKNDIQTVVKTYENMESEDAARILMQYQDKTKVVQIISMLNHTKSAEILSSMTPSFAAELLQLMDEE